MADKKVTITTAEHRRIASAAESAIILLKEEAAIALKTQKEEAALQLRVLAEAAAVALKTANSAVKNSDDHDLLIRLETLMSVIQKDIKEIKDGTERRITDLENNKADAKALETLEIEVHVTREARMRILENKADRFWITVGLYSLFIAGLTTVLLLHVFKT